MLKERHVVRVLGQRALVVFTLRSGDKIRGWGEWVSYRFLWYVTVFHLIGPR